MSPLVIPVKATKLHPPMKARNSNRQRTSVHDLFLMGPLKSGSKESEI